MGGRDWAIGLVGLLLALSGCEAKNPGGEPSPAPNAVVASPNATVPQGPARHILAFGDSLFAGYGLGQGESYPDQLQAALRARGFNVTIANAGVSGDTTAAGRERLAFTLGAQNPKPDLALLELGGNDLLRGLPPDQTRANLDAMLAELAKRKIPVVLMGMRAPPNVGPEFQAKFDAIYPALAAKYHAGLVPFFLQTVYDKPALIQADHIHPTKAGAAKIVAATVDQVAGALPKAD
jgi:acyl-CoA thioesterase-1